MIKTVIIDDEEQARKVVANYLNRYGSSMVLVGQAESVGTGVELIQKQQPDLVFLDVNMQDGTGFDLLCQLERVDFMVVFVTAYEEFAVRAFRFNAIDYLLKPLSPQEFRQCLERISERTTAPQDLRDFVHERHSPRRLTLRTQDNIHIVSVDEIVRCESDNSYTTFFLQDGRSILLSRSMKMFQEILWERQFVRSHRSHIVNLFFVDRFDRANMVLRLQDGQEVPVSNRRRDEVVSLMERMG